VFLKSASVPVKFCDARAKIPKVTAPIMALGANIGCYLDDGRNPLGPKVTGKVNASRKKLGCNIGPLIFAALEHKSLVGSRSRAVRERLGHVRKNDKTTVCTLELPHIKHGRAKAVAVVATVGIEMQVTVC